MAVVEEGFKVTLEGDEKPLEAAVNAAVKSLNKVDKAAQTASKGLGKMNGVSAKIADQASDLAKGAAKAGGALDKTGKSSGAATQSLINLSRVAQDAPYGFIGIANNLNPLLESFQRLRKETGSGGKALKAFGSSLVGAGGIGLALGIVSSLMVVFGDRLFKSTSAAEKQADAIKKAKDQLQAYADSLNDIQKVDLFGTQNAQEELVKLRTLFKAASDVNIPLAQRKKIVDQLQEQYPKYFANIKDEVILTGGATSAYNNLTSAILASSKARAAQETIVDLQKQLLTVEQQITDNQSKRNSLQKQYSKQIAGENKVRASTDEFGRLINDETEASFKLNHQINKSLEDGNKLYDQRFELQKRLNSVSSLLTGIVEKDPAALLDPTGNIKELKKVKVKPKEVEFSLKGVRVETLGLDVLRAELQQGHEFDNFFQLRPKRVSVDFSKSTMEVKFAEKLKQINDVVTPAIQQIGVQIGSGIGDAFGAALTGGNVGDAFKGILNSIGSIIQQLGAQIIALSPLIAAVKAAIKSFSPAGILAAGVGLVALGGVIKAATSVKGFAEGGLAFGPTLGLVGEGRGTTRSNPEVIAPLNKLSQFLGGGTSQGQLVAVVRGSQIKLVSNREDRRQRRVR